MSKTHVLESVELYGSHKRVRHWSFDGGGKPPRSPVSPLHRDSVTGLIDGSAERPDRSHLSKWTPKVKQPDYPAAKQSGDRVAGSQLEITSKKLWRLWKQGDDETHAIITDDGAKLVPVLIKIVGDDGEERMIQPKLIRNTLHLSVYGRTFTFTKCKNRGNSVLDGRDGKRKPLAFIEAELQRMLGVNAGNVAYATLVGA